MRQVGCIHTSIASITFDNKVLCLPQALAELGRAMQACPYGAPDEATQQWFLRDRRLAVDEAVEKLTAYVKWRKEFLPPGGLAWEHVADEAGSGKAYLHTHPDVNGRPVIVVRVSKHITGAAWRAHQHMIENSEAS